TDINGAKAERIRWDCGCLQKRCGACAMVINGRPALACGARLGELKQPIRVEPLRKFPVVADLTVDRSVMLENLKTVKAWIEAQTAREQKREDDEYEASRCLQCGCCLEVCPNFDPKGGFFGMAAAIPVSRLLSQLGKEDRKELAAKYRRHIYAGCGKSLACHNICPAGIDIEKLLVNSNSAAVWKHLFDR
ncbi:MAG: succinate dehydrogenase, partial [Oscillospiraceae bacterium]|nr:succinate dehydrogenase [Oscillospiraceae bacterium]